MYTMDRAEWLAFVLAGTRTGKLATVRRNGMPHVAPIWFLIDTVDGVDEIVFNTGKDTLKGKALARDPRFAMLVDDERPPFSFVQFEAEARISEEPVEILEWATRLGTRYMGDEAGEAFGRRNAVPGELLVRGRITKVIAKAEIAD